MSFDNDPRVRSVIRKADEDGPYWVITLRPGWRRASERPNRHMDTFAARSMTEYGLIMTGVVSCHCAMCRERLAITFH